MAITQLSNDPSSSLPPSLLLLTVLLSIYTKTVYAAAVSSTHPPSAAVTCIRRGSIPPSVPAPLAQDCQALAHALLTVPLASSPRLFVDKDKSWGPSFLALPILARNGSCQLQIHTDGRPFYDIASLRDFADIVHGTVTRCLDGSFQEAVGGRDSTGENNWLQVWVTGRWVSDDDEVGDLARGRAMFGGAGLYRYLSDVEGLAVMGNRTSDGVMGLIRWLKRC